MQRPKKTLVCGVWGGPESGWRVPRLLILLGYFEIIVGPCWVPPKKKSGETLARLPDCDQISATKLEGHPRKRRMCGERRRKRCGPWKTPSGNYPQDSIKGLQETTICMRYGANAGEKTFRNTLQSLTKFSSQQNTLQVKWLESFPGEQSRLSEYHARNSSLPRTSN